MRVGVNALYLRPGRVGGTERYLRELLPALLAASPDTNWTLFVAKEGEGIFSGLGECVREVVAPVSASGRVRRILAEQRWLAAKLGEEKTDVCFNPGATLPLRSPCPQVTTIHDCITKVRPKQFGFLERTALEFFVRESLRRSARIIVPSEAAAGDLISYYSASTEKITVTPLAAPASFTPEPKEGDSALLERLGLKAGGYFLSVASTLPHKNLPLLFRAHARCRKHRPTLAPLVWTGPGDPQGVEVLVKKLGVEDSVRVLSWTGLAEMAPLYRGARGTLLASAYEGFGLAALEALACGSPLLTTLCPAVREVVGTAALFSPGFSEEELAGALLKFDENEALRKRLASEGPQRAMGFSWAKTARRTLAALRQNA